MALSPVPFNNDKGNQESRTRLSREIFLELGGGMVKIELDPEHYTYAINKALDRYRYRSSNAVEEAYIFFEMQNENNTYIMPQEVVEVRTLYRRGVSGGITGGAYVDPFSLAYTNAYILNAGGAGGLSSGMGGLATYDFFMQYQETLGRMFGRDINYTFDPSTKKLTLMRRPIGSETILAWAYNYRPDHILLNDIYAKSWLRDYATAVCKAMIGQARSKFGALGGPQGGTQLNGADLKAEADATMERLEEELKNQTDNNAGYGLIIG